MCGVAFLGLELVLAIQGRDVDRSAVQRRADVAESGAIIVRASQASLLLVRVLPELRHEAHGLDRFLGFDDHLALRVDLLAAEGPHQRIGEGGRVAERVAERLADRVLRRLQLLADLVVLLPRLRKLLGSRLRRTTICGTQSTREPSTRASKPTCRRRGSAVSPSRRFHRRSCSPPRRPRSRPPRPMNTGAGSC